MDEIEKLLARHRQEKAAGRDRNVPPKTADEMFRELGYVATITQTNERWYRKTVNDYTITVIVDFDTKTVDCKLGRETVPMELGEVLACAQLIKEEMEGGNLSN